MSNENIKELRDKILKGLDLTYKRLLLTKQKEDGELIFSKNGQIIKIKANKIDK
jgi:hypothetical protein